MSLGSKELQDRGRDRLQSIFEAIERGEPVDWEKQGMLSAIEDVQLGRAFATECAQSIREADDAWRSRANQT